mgnify:CR=1 FL=1
MCCRVASQSTTLPREDALAWRVVWTLTLCTSLSLLGDATLYAVLPSHLEVLGITALQVGWLLSVNRLSRLPLNLPSGWLSNRIGHKTPYILGLAIGALSTAGYGLTQSFWLLLLLRILWGIAWALLVVAAYGLILEASTKETRGRLVGTYASFSFFGGAVGAMLGGFLVDERGFAEAFIILGVCSALACALALTLPKRQRPPAPVDPSSGWDEGTVPPLGDPPHRRSWALQGLGRLTGRAKRVWLVWSLNLAHRFFFAGIFYATFGYYLRYVLGDQIHWAGVTIGIASLTATLLFVRNGITVLAGPILGYLSDRLGDRRRVLLLGEILGVLGLTSLAASRSLWVLGVGVTLVAVAYGIVPSMLMAWLGDLGRQGEREQLVGAYQTMGDLGSGLGPLAAYSLVTGLGPQTVYLLGAGLLSITIPLIIRARRWES